MEYVPRPTESVVVYPTTSGGVGIDIGCGVILMDADDAKKLASSIAHVLRDKWGSL